MLCWNVADELATECTNCVVAIHVLDVDHGVGVVDVGIRISYKF